MKATIPKEMRKIVRDAMRRGWVLSCCGSGHWKLFKPGYRPVYISSSSSDRRASRNVLREMRSAGIIPRKEGT